MRIMKLSRYNLQPLERELDRIAEKHDIEPDIHKMVTTEIFEDDEEEEE